MNMGFNVVNPININNWNELLLLTKGENLFFFNSSWSKVLSETYNYKPRYFIKKNDDRFTVLLPFMEIAGRLIGKRAVSLPFTDYCHPIINDRIEFDEVFSNLIDYGRKHDWKYFEIRGDKNLPPGLNSSTFRLNHILKLSKNIDDIYSGVKNSTRRNIKKAFRNGVVVRIDNSFESLKTYYTLHMVTRKRHGLPPQPFRFFKKIYDHIISRELGSVFISYYGERPIAGAIYFHFGKHAMFKYGASDKRFQGLRMNDIVMWEAIKWYANMGFEQFCFGITNPQNHGLRRFKLGWGSTERRINYFRYDLRKNVFIDTSNYVYGFHNKIFRILPMWFSKYIGEVAYRYFG